MSTAHQITDLLNRDERTIAELAETLGLSRNSVNVHVMRLEAAGVVEKVHREIPAGAGKPAWVYRTARGGEDAFSSAYKPVLAALVATLGAGRSRRARANLFDATGRALARDGGLAPTGKVKADVQRAVDAVNAFGALAELAEDADRMGRPYVRCHTCPLASLVHDEPMVCEMVGAFFAEATGLEVEVCCQRDGAVVCGFAFGGAP